MNILHQTWFKALLLKAVDARAQVLDVMHENIFLDNGSTVCSVISTPRTITDYHRHTV